MARIRSIKPDFFLDEELAALDPLDRLTFIGLWTQADKSGRLEDRPTRLQVQILPYDKGTFRERLCRLAAGGFIVRYEVDGHKYIWIRTFDKHQRPHHTEAESCIPRYEGEVTVIQPLEHGNMPDSQGMEGKGRERNGREGSGHARLMPSVLGFDDFWARYPRRVGKQAARKAWERLDLGNGLLERIMQAVLDQRQSEAWTKDAGQFIPHPATWLNGKRWEDEGSAVSPIRTLLDQSWHMSRSHKVELTTRGSGERIWRCWGPPGHQGICGEGKL